MSQPIRTPHPCRRIALLFPVVLQELSEREGDAGGGRPQMMALKDESIENFGAWAAVPYRVCVGGCIPVMGCDLPLLKLVGGYFTYN